MGVGERDFAMYLEVLPREQFFGEVRPRCYEALNGNGQFTPHTVYKNVKLVLKSVNAVAEMMIRMVTNDHEGSNDSGCHGDCPYFLRRSGSSASKKRGRIRKPSPDHRGRLLDAEDRGPGFPERMIHPCVKRDGRRSRG